MRSKHAALPVVVYFRMYGWNEEGFPSRSKLEELGIGWVADLIE